MAPLADLDGRRALVTGGNRGIGLEVVRLLATLGADVMLGCRSLEAGREAAASLGLPEVTPIRIDVADRDSVAAAREYLAAEGVDVLVNNAGIYPRGNVTAAQIDEAWQVNALGAWRLSQALVPAMRERGWGRIVNVSTELATGAHERRGGGIYPVTKVVLNAMTRALAEDLTGTGILVNACSPGWCRSDMGGDDAPRSAEQGAGSIVWGVTLADDGPTGGFFQDGRPLPW